MTDSIKSILNLSALPKAMLEHIPVVCTGRFKPKAPGPLTPFHSWQTVPSPLTRNGMRFKVVTDAELVPTALIGDFNIPNATVGQNAELGHSCYAANLVALDLFKTFLAKHGVPRDALNLLSVEDMQANSATITYLVPVPAGRDAQSILGEIAHRFEQFFPVIKPKNDSKAKTKKPQYGGSTVGSKGSRTAYLRQRGFNIRAYSSPIDTIEGDPNDPVHQSRIAFVRNVVRIELTLTVERLRKHQLQPATAWATAHPDDVYENLFNEYVREKGLRLHERLRTDKPKETDLAKLSDVNRHIVEGYLAGKDLAGCELLKRSSKLAVQKAKSAAARAIFKLLRIDINIPWAEHRKLGNTWMEKVIVYPGDHHPPAERVSTSFCQANLPALQAQLQIELERQLALQSGDGNVDPDTGEVLAE
ncbi:hypothetical protein GJ698_26035 [Pseudoduganella sp. FT26W]|uniref:Replication-associated protein G2P N-terminal domain-containing protein n=1 Tax=Duganella aquatilis TaxID=2666082 RepID=A0A844DF40_9BURK|nr:hypothetical protein [Duganella aquatilis]MRW87536.1 hypothetical protein [Duganella aquatilis]